MVPGSGAEMNEMKNKSRKYRHREMSGRLSGPMMLLLLMMLCSEVCIMCSNIIRVCAGVMMFAPIKSNTHIKHMRVAYIYLYTESISQRAEYQLDQHACTTQSDTPASQLIMYQIAARTHAVAAASKLYNMRVSATTVPSESVQCWP